MGSITQEMLRTMRAYLPLYSNIFMALQHIIKGSRPVVCRDLSNDVSSFAVCTILGRVDQKQGENDASSELLKDFCSK